MQSLSFSTAAHARCQDQALATQPHITAPSPPQGYTYLDAVATVPAYTHPLVSAASFLLTRACAASSPPLRSCLNTPRKLSSMASMNDSSSVRGRLCSSVGIANVHQFSLLPPRLLTDTVIKADDSFSAAATCEPRASQYAQPAHGSQSSFRRTDSGGTAFRNLAVSVHLSQVKATRG